MITELAENAKGKDEYGYRKEFISLIKTSETIADGMLEAKK